ncbi:MAG: hypothetical protein K2O67_01175, partial [Clostridia bacterium]|nr:hypothetical protein [Clostridia bacterium]
MAENENVVVNQDEVSVEQQQTAPVAEVAETTAVVQDAPAKESFGAKVKEWFRKRIVNLKRKPQNIAFLVLVVTSILFLMSLNTFSYVAFKRFNDVAWLGLCIFVSTLFSILVLILFLNTFPKYPKVNKKTGKKRYINYVMMALVFVFIAAMIAVDIIYYHILTGKIAGNESRFFETLAEANRYSQYWGEKFTANPELDPTRYAPQLKSSLNLAIAHVVMLGISALLLATLPLYKKLILKINTKKEIADNNMKEVI